MSAVPTTLVALAGLAALVLSGLRWLRVAQREHYLPGSTTRFAARWWSSSPLNIAGFSLAIGGAIVSLWLPVVTIVPVAVVAIGPLGLSVRGRTSQLAWTRRLRSLAVVATAIDLIVAGGLSLVSTTAAVAIGALLVPMAVDLAAAILAPFEERAGRRFIDQATARLGRVAPRIVGITGSYGKTSVKNHLVALIGGDLAVVPSPRSFNNRAGLARAINEHLAEGTDVFVAEMGTYGPGEIADMCAWCPPSVAVLTAIGPVHLERFGSLDVTLAAKTEITPTAEVVVANIDDERLAGLADRLDLAGKSVIRVASVRHDADVVVSTDEVAWGIEVGGVRIGASPVLMGLQPTNVACAIGAAIALGLDPTVVVARVGALTTVENRLGVVRAPSGVTVIDDTFNSNPAGADAALDVLAGLAVGGRRVVVTPGMVELGDRQAEENERFGRRAAEVADVVLIVGRTNRRSLRRGIRTTGAAEMIEVPTREKAVQWVRANLGTDDAVLYENDLPDNYP